MQRLEADNIFLRELNKGYTWQLWVAVAFLREGFTVKVPRLVIRPDHDSIGDYTDSGDIIILLGQRAAVFECKSRSLSFTSVSDYPYDTAIVDRVVSWTRKAIRPVAVLLVSQLTGKIIAIPTSTQSHWLRGEKDDSVRGYSREYYLAPRDCLMDWPQLILWLRMKEGKQSVRG